MAAQIANAHGSETHSDEDESDGGLDDLLGISSLDCASESEEDGCPICLNDIAPDEEVMVLPCAHSFHTKCVSDWLKRKTLCPCCNSDVAKVVREDAGEGNARDAHRSDY